MLSCQDQWVAGGCGRGDWAGGRPKGVRAWPCRVPPFSGSSQTGRASARFALRRRSRPLILIYSRSGARTTTTRPPASLLNHSISHTSRCHTSSSWAPFESVIDRLPMVCLVGCPFFSFFLSLSPSSYMLTCAL